MMQEFLKHLITATWAMFGHLLRLLFQYCSRQVFSSSTGSSK